MDRLADDKQAMSNDSNRSKHVYNMHDSKTNNSSSSSAYPTLDLLCVNTSNNNNDSNSNNNNHNNNNNNNNEKMDDANQTIAPNAKFACSVRQDSINSDLSPLTESIQMNDGSRNGGGGGGGGVGSSDNNSSIDLNAADDEYSSVNDNQSASSDEHASSDNNSTDNISFVSEDIVENIIVLPNNFLSEDDESTNSDDVVYAYRGADVGDHLNGIGVGIGGGDDLNADDETDFLEMDFEPDPASEIEAPEQQRIEPNLLPLPSLNCNNMANAPLTIATQSNAIASDRNMERTGVHKNWLAPIDDVRHANGIYATNDDHDGGNHVAINKTNNKLDVNGVNGTAPQANSIEHESNKSLEFRKMMSNSILAAAAVAQKSDDLYSSSASSPYYDKTVSLSTNKKYTGTIPKTNSKLQLLVRPTKSRGTVDCNGIRSESHATSASCSTPPPSHLDLQSTSSNKRWKISDQMVPIEDLPMASTSYCDSFDGTDGVTNANCGHPKHPAAVVRSMSFPNAANDSSYLFGIRAIRCEPTGADNDVGQPASVTFESTYCTVETIVKALVRRDKFESVKFQVKTHFYRFSSFRIKSTCAPMCEHCKRYCTTAMNKYCT